MKRLALERQKLGWSQSELARRIGSNPGCINRIERDKEKPYRLRAQRIADALHWKGDPMELFEEVAEDEPAASN